MANFQLELMASDIDNSKSDALVPPMITLSPMLAKTASGGKHRGHDHPRQDGDGRSRHNASVPACTAVAGCMSNVPTSTLAVSRDGTPDLPNPGQALRPLANSNLSGVQYDAGNYRRRPLEEGVMMQTLAYGGVVRHGLSPGETLTQGFPEHAHLPGTVGAVLRKIRGNVSQSRTHWLGPTFAGMWSMNEQQGIDFPRLRISGVEDTPHLIRTSNLSFQERRDSGNAFLLGGPTMVEDVLQRWKPSPSADDTID
ncbi:hypothetical protein OG21DRAFT_1606270 [Imleria badia]|nr:hypothetical protein OG21DRAFT_1606270 [Imleria badia]